MDDDYILAHCSESGESIARAMGKDGANVRKRIRKLRAAYPKLPWYEDVRHRPNPVAQRQDHRLKPVTPRQSQRVDVGRTVVCGDLHIPYHDRDAIGCLLGYLRDTKPEAFIFNGDLVDMYQCSSFGKEPTRELELQQDIDIANDVLDAFDAALPKGCRKVFVLGNHEVRLSRWLKDHARNLYGLRALSLDALLRLTERGYEIVPMIGRDASLMVGKVEVGHFNKASQHSAYTAKALVDERGCSVIQSHTHRLGAYYKRQRGTGQYLGGWEIGCMCDLNPEYVSNPNWSHGFATISRVESSSRYHVALHEILGGELLAAGRRY